MTDTDRLEVNTENFQRLTESMRELELALDLNNWVQLTSNWVNEFSRSGLSTIVNSSRLTYLKNPLIKRGVTAKAQYVFGRGINISARDDAINAVIQAFIDDIENLREITSQPARILKEVELQTTGNLFFVLFTHIETGSVRVRSFPVDEIADIITDPNDRKKVWFYKRVYTQREFNLNDGEWVDKTYTVYYRDFNYNTELQSIAGSPIDPYAVIYHVKVGGFDNWLFGLSEIYSALDWSQAYKSFLADYSTIIKSLARFAWQVKTSGGSRGIQAAKAKLTSTLASGGTDIERNPPPIAGSVFVGDSANQLDPVKTAGSTTSAEDGRPIRVMVAAGLDIPETFFGDVSTGNLATAESLDRPTELAFINRQELWKFVYSTLLNYVLLQAVKANHPALRGIIRLDVNEYNEEILVFSEGINQKITIDFPPILERSTKDVIASIISVATLDGKALSLITDPKVLLRMLLNALGESDVDEVINLLYPEDSDPLPDPLPDELAVSMQDVKEALSALTESIRNNT